MAARYWVNGGTGNWNSTSNWSATSGGASGASFPTSVDDVTFDVNGNSSAIINVDSAAKSITITSGYTSTITFTNNLTVRGNITIGSNVVLSGSGYLVCAATSTLTSNGKTIPNFRVGTDNITATLADNWNVVNLNFSITTNNVTLNGFTLYVSGDLTSSNTTGRILGTTAIVMNGTGTLATNSSSTNGGGFATSGGLTINTSGTITLGTILGLYGISFTITAGTIIATSNTISWYGTTGNSLSTHSGVTLGSWTQTNTTINVTLLTDIRLGGDYIVSSANNTSTLSGGKSLYVAGIFSYATGTLGLVGDTGTKIVMNGTSCSLLATGGAPNGALKINTEINTTGNCNLLSDIPLGAITFTHTSGTIVDNGYVLACNTSGTLSLDFGGRICPRLIYKSIGTISLLSSIVVSLYLECLISSDTSRANIISYLPGTKMKMTLSYGADKNIGFLNATDIDSGDGQTVRGFLGVFSNTVNWAQIENPKTKSMTFFY